MKNTYSRKPTIVFDCTYSTCRTDEGGREGRKKELKRGREAVEEKKTMQGQSQTTQAWR
jgi:hypothetical protein